MDVIEINSVTGQVTERDYTAAELVQRKTDAANAKAAATEQATAEATRLATITAARDHAASLGFTEVMLDVMYPQLTEGA